MADPASSDCTSTSRPASPLRHEAFRAIWIAAVFSYIGTWVQDVGESWLMLSLTRDPLPVALLTTAMTLPMFALLMPAGVMADRLDRRHILMISQGLMAVVALALAIATALGRATPAALLIASAGLGVGSALSSPSWNTLLPELVPRRETAEAVTLNSVAFNIARTVGPALGGVILATRGPATAFFVNAVSFLAVIEVLRRFDAFKRVASASRAARKHEPLARALAAAFVQVRRRATLRNLHVAVASFSVAAASVPALLPVFAKERLHTGSSGYGLMLGSLGIGAVFAAFALKRLRGLVSSRGLVSFAMATYGVSIVAMSTTRSLSVAIACLFPAGMAWLTTFSTLNALVQLSAPVYLKSRALALYQLVFYAAWSGGALAGGTLANHVGAPLTIAIAAVGTLAAAALASRLTIPSYDEEAPISLAPGPIATPAPVSAR